MDKLLYLTYCITNALFYILIKYKHIKMPNYPTYEIGAYANIVSLAIMMLYFVKHYKKVIKGFKENLKIIIVAPAALLKFIAIAHISPKNAMAISFLTPVIVTILSFVTLKEEFKVKDLFTKYIWMLLSFIGVLVFIGSDFTFSMFAYTLMLIHIGGKAFFHIFTKQLSKNSYTVLFYGVLYNSIFTITTSIWRKKSGLDLQMVFDPIILFIGSFSVICQFALIQSYKIAKKISLLQNLDYSRIMFSSIGAYFILSEKIKGREWLGMIIVLYSVLGSQYSQFGKMKLYKILPGLLFNKKNLKASK